MPVVASKEYPTYLDIDYDETSIAERIRRLSFYVPYASFWLSYYQQMTDGAEALAQQYFNKINKTDDPFVYAVQTKKIQRFTRIATSILAVATGAAIITGLITAGIITVSNPLGWALLGAAALAALGFLTYKATQWLQKRRNRRQTRMTIALTENFTTKAAELNVQIGLDAADTTLADKFALFPNDQCGKILTDAQIATLCDGLDAQKAQRLRYVLGFSQEQVLRYATMADIDPNDLDAVIKHSESSNLFADQHSGLHAKRITFYTRSIVTGAIAGALLGFLIGLSGLGLIGTLLTGFALSFTGVGLVPGIVLIIVGVAALGALLGYDYARDASEHRDVNNARKIKGIDDENDPKRFKFNRYMREAFLGFFGYVFGVPEVFAEVAIPVDGLGITGLASSRYMRKKPIPAHVQLGTKIRGVLGKALTTQLETKKNGLLTTGAQGEASSSADKRQLAREEQTQLTALKAEHKTILSHFTTQNYDHTIEAAAQKIFAADKRAHLIQDLKNRLLPQSKGSSLANSDAFTTHFTELLFQQLGAQITPQIQTEIVADIGDTISTSINNAIAQNPDIVWEIATSEWPELKQLYDAWVFCQKTHAPRSEYEKIFSFFEFKYKNQGDHKFRLKDLTEADLIDIAAFWKEEFQIQKTKLDKTRISDFIVHQLFYNVYFIYNEILIKFFMWLTGGNIILDPVRLLRNNPNATGWKSFGLHVLMITLILLRLAVFGIPALAFGAAKTILDGIALLPVINKIVCALVDIYQLFSQLTAKYQMPWYAKGALALAFTIASPLLFLYNLSFIPNFISQYPKLFRAAQENNAKTAAANPSYNSLHLGAIYTLRYLYAVFAPPLLYIMDWLSVGKNSYSMQRAAYMQRKETARSNLVKLAAYEQAKKSEAAAPAPVDAKAPTPTATEIFTDIKNSVQQFTDRKNNKQPAAPEPTKGADWNPDWGHFFFGRMNEKPAGSKPESFPCRPAYRHILAPAV